MKKLITSSSLVILAAFSVAAQDTYVTQIPSEEVLITYGGVNILGMSGNGQYVCGSTMSRNGFIYSAEADKTFVVTPELGAAIEGEGAQLLSVSNDGLAVGFDDKGGIKVTFDGKCTHIDGNGSLRYITPDGSLIVGSIIDIVNFYQKPAYWINDLSNMLPYPTEEEAGFRVNGAVAFSASDDGSIILGYLLDRGGTNPMILWERQDDGSYAYIPVWENRFEPVNTEVWDEDGNLLGYKRGDNPYLWFRPGAISGDGKHVAMHIKENTNENRPPMVLGIYDVETGETNIVIDEGGLLQSKGEFIIGGIANDCTVVGTVGALYLGTEPFIKYADNPEALTFPQAWPLEDNLLIYEDYMAAGMPFIGTTITSDSSYVTGYVIDLNMEGIGFIVSTGVDTGVETVTVESSDDTTYYTLDGLRHNAPVKGINIVRLPGGESKKFIMK